MPKTYVLDAPRAGADRPVVHDGNVIAHKHLGTGRAVTLYEFDGDPAPAQQFAALVQAQVFDNEPDAQRAFTDATS